MTIPWIQVYSNLLSHPKTFAFAAKLSLSDAQVRPNATAAGMLVGIWSLCAQSAADGVFPAHAGDALASAAGWRGQSDELLRALLETGLMERRADGTLHIHNWENYAILLIDQVEQRKVKTRERVRRYRARQAEQGAELMPVERDADVTDTLHNAPTKPDPTAQNQTPQNQTIACATTSISADAHAGFVPPTVAEIAAYCKENGLCTQPQVFHDYYSDRSWMLGKKRMRSWKAVIRGWEKRAGQGAPEESLHSGGLYPEEVARLAAYRAARAQEAAAEATAPAAGIDLKEATIPAEDAADTDSANTPSGG